MVWGGNYSVDSDLMVSTIQPKTLSGVYSLKHQYPEAYNGGMRGSHAYVDFANNEIGFYNPTDTTAEKLVSKTCSFEFAQGKTYEVQVRTIGGHDLTITITDKAAKLSDSVTFDSDMGSYFARATGYRVDEYNENDINVLSKKVYSLQPYNAKMLIMGDSYVEGFYKIRYATRIKNKLSGSAFINGFSGGDTKHVKQMLTYLPDICDPEYIVVAIGTNNYYFDEWKTDMEEILATIEEKFNATPILATITFINEGSNYAFANEANTWIRNSGYKYVDINKATTINNDMQTYDISLFQGDKVHLNDEGNRKAYNQFLIDVPEMFK